MPNKSAEAPSTETHISNGEHTDTHKENDKVKPGEDAPKEQERAQLGIFTCLVVSNYARKFAKC